MHIVTIALLQNVFCHELAPFELSEELKATLFCLALVSFLVSTNFYSSIPPQSVCPSSKFSNQGQPVSISRCYARSLPHRLTSRTSLSYRWSKESPWSPRFPRISSSTSTPSSATCTAIDPTQPNETSPDSVPKEPNRGMPVYTRSQ